MACACLVGPFKAFLQVSEGLLVEPVYCLCTYTSAKLYYLLWSLLYRLCVLLCYWPIFLRQSDGIVCQQQKSVRGLHHLWSAEALGWLVWVVSWTAAVTGDPGEAVTQQLSSESCGAQKGDNMHTHLPTLRRGCNLRPLNTQKDWRRFYNWWAHPLGHHSAFKKKENL